MSHTMGSRTYVPTIVHILKTVCRYIVNHRETLVAVMPAGTNDALNALMTACEVFLALAAAVEEVPV